MHLNNISTDRKLALLFSLFVYLLYKIDNYCLSIAFANKNIENNTYLNSLSVGKKVYLFSTLSICLFKTSCTTIVYRFVNLE